MRPVIGIVPLVDHQRDSLWMLPDYMEGIAQAGGLPIMLPLTDDEAQLGQLLGMCSGILFTGGQDVDPAVYNAEKLEICGELCPRRDRMELPLLRAALEADKPVLGICRGLQFINAALGGSLYQDLSRQHPSNVCHRMQPPYHLPAHTVCLEAGSPLQALLGDVAAPLLSGLLDLLAAAPAQAVQTLMDALEDTGMIDLLADALSGGSGY